MASFNPLVAEDVVLAFPTPVLVRELPNAESLNERLKSVVMARAEAEGSIDHSNVGGWRSPGNLFDWTGPEIDELRMHVGAAVSRMTAITTERDQADIDAGIYGWANVLYHGAYNLPHTHPTCMWAGVYYVDIGERPAEDHLSGIIEFADPRAGVSVLPLPGNPFDGRFKVEPRTGHMLLFPAWLLHFVHSYHGSRPRISIAFNVSDVSIVEG